MDGLEPTTRPAQYARQIDLQAQLSDGVFERAGLFDVIDGGLELYQRARKPCGKAIGEQRERAMTLRAIPTRNTCARWTAPLISAMACKGTRPLRMQRTVFQGCIPPGLLGNVFRAGEARCKSKLHRPWVRTAVTVADPLLSKKPAAIISALTR